MQTISKAVNHLLNLLLFLIVALMCVFYFGNVVLRYLFDSGIPWAEEVCRFLFIYLTFLGAIAGLKDSQHLGVDMLVKKLPHGMKKAVFIFSNVAVGFCLWLVLDGSWKMTIVAHESNAPATGLPMSFIYAVGIITSISMLLILMCNLYRVMFKATAEADLIAVRESEELGAGH
ncbi:TRAP transporter small permease [Paenibacillus xerothermodurans]|uniref:TRAP transporter small permease n=1 Tax=Paenibacillus xerothermodurans TaxID=1977292 RepID=A0A2W1NI12_PAEXE|nr:TRAP transporter small permease [Paenibacillus xerothermodurans]PZE22791.1 TRAP transporter small permease [Paenibacillus xerothermodurans]